MSERISVFLVDDHRIFSQAFEAYVSTQPGFSWKGSADGTGRSLRDMLRLAPDVVLLDFHLKEENGLVFLRRLRDSGFKGRVVMLTMNRDARIRQDAENLGADGFVSKDADGEELLQGLRRLMERETGFLDIPHSRKEPTVNPYHLTRQELMIAGMVCSGMNSEQISRKLNISIHTVHTHRRRILEKTESGSFMEVCRKLV